MFTNIVRNLRDNSIKVETTFLGSTNAERI